MALLQMVNSVRGKLREERVGTISSDDLVTTEVIDLINDAAAEILGGDDWDFDVRHDGRAWFPATQTGAGAVFAADAGDEIYENTTRADLYFAGETDSGEIFEDIDMAGFRCSGNRIRARVVPTADASFSNTSWIITGVDKRTATLRLTLGSNLYIDQSGDLEAWRTYANELVLPDTVKEILSIRNEEQPIPLVFVDRETQFDQWVPRSIDSFAVTPEIAMVGGTITSTARTSTIDWTTIDDEAAVTGAGLTIWSIPSSDLHLQYSYRIQHADISEDTDSFEGVPTNVVRLIEWLAYQKALDSGIQNDPEAARRAERQVEKRLMRAQAQQSRQPNRRRIPTAFGSAGRGNQRRRWSSQTISAS